jgi:hypothetical protein
MGPVIFHGLHGDMQLGGDLPRSESLAYELKDLQLPVSENIYGLLSSPALPSKNMLNMRVAISLLT